MKSISQILCNTTSGIILMSIFCLSTTYLDVSANTALTSLLCHLNQLTNLDVSANTVITDLRVYNNQLTSLNVQNGNNSNFSNTLFNTTGNPNLNCILVDDSTYSANNWTNIDAGTVFRSNASDCSVLNSTSEVTTALPDLNIYPNPTSKNISISLGKGYNNTSIEVRNSLGQLLFVEQYNGIHNPEIELWGVAGVYFVRVRTEEGEAALKVVKE